MVKVRGVRVMWCYGITLGRAGGPLAATSIGWGRKYKTVSICRMSDNTDFTARDKRISDVKASDLLYLYSHITSTFIICL